MSEALRNGKAIITSFSRSSLSRQLLRSIQEELGAAKLCPIIGTANRWFHKMSSIERLLEIRSSVELFQARATSDRIAEEDDPVETITEEDWILMKEYVNAVKRFETLSKFLGGQTYPAATSVIPSLDQIKEDLESLMNDSVEGTEENQLLSNLLQSMQKRFPNCWKNKNPYNCLTYLDPRYIDMYADTDDLKKKVYSDISDDSAFDLVKFSAVIEENSSTNAVNIDNNSVPVSTSASSSASIPARVDSSATGSSRREALLAKKQEQLRPVVPTASFSFETRLKEEFER